MKVSKSLRLMMSLVCATGVFRGSAQTTNLVELHGHRPLAVTRLKPLGRLSAAKQMKLALGVPLHDPEGMSNLLREVYDPSSTNFHHFLTPDEFTSRFGPTEAEYQNAIDFAATHGLTVTSGHSNRLLLEVSGAVAKIEDAFHVKINLYQHPHESRTFFAPDAEPSVEKGTRILDIDGLNSYYRPKPKMRLKTRNTLDSYARVGSGPNGYGYMGNDFRAAYVPGITNTGVGQTVALVEFDGYYTNDIRLYETYAGLSTGIVISNVYLNGFSGAPTTGAQAENSEVALDIEMTISMAPGVRIIVYEEPPNEEPLGNVMWNKIAVDNSARQISCSWEVSANATSDNIFQEYALQGQTLFDASGDDGAYIGTIPPPSEDPYMTQVGGTTLTTSGAGGPWASETTWFTSSTESSSGGVSDMYVIPAWQAGINMIGNAGSFTRRNFPDVAAVADDVFIVADNGQQEGTGGTSAAAPLWAGLAALVNQQAANTGKPSLGFLNPLLYRLALQSNYKSNFHDITTGNNINGIGVSEFYAGTGYDLCTGLGTPAGNHLFNALLASPDALQVTPLATFHAAGTVGGPFNFTSQALTLTNTGNSSLNWTSYIGANWLSLSTSSGVLTANGSINLTASLNSAASNLTAGTYATSVWITNLATGLGVSRQFSLQVGQPIVQNGSFETGDFSYWVLTGDANFNLVDNGTISGASAESGSYFAIMGPTNLPPALLTQTLPTIPGQIYALSFWLANPNTGGSSFPNQIYVSWNGTNVFNQTNFPVVSSYTNIQLRVTAAGPSTDLIFGFRNDNGDFLFDNVTVQNIPTPTIRNVSRIANAISFSWDTAPNQRYQIQYKTNYAQTNWFILGGKWTANGTSMSMSDATTNDAQRFYRVVLLP